MIGRRPADPYFKVSIEECRIERVRIRFSPHTNSVRVTPAEGPFKISTVHLSAQQFDWLTGGTPSRPTLSGARKMALRLTPQYKNPRHRARPMESCRSGCVGLRVAMLQAARRCCRNVASRRVRDFHS
jgi:hypothetical protein